MRYEHQQKSQHDQQDIIVEPVPRRICGRPARSPRLDPKVATELSMWAPQHRRAADTALHRLCTDKVIIGYAHEEVCSRARVRGVSIPPLVKGAFFVILEDVALIVDIARPQDRSPLVIGIFLLPDVDGDGAPAHPVDLSSLYYLIDDTQKAHTDDLAGRVSRSAPSTLPVEMYALDIVGSEVELLDMLAIQANGGEAAFTRPATAERPPLDMILAAVSATDDHAPTDIMLMLAQRVLNAGGAIGVAVDDLRLCDIALPAPPTLRSLPSGLADILVNALSEHATLPSDLTPDLALALSACRGSAVIDITLIVGETEAQITLGISTLAGREAGQKLFVATREARFILTPPLETPGWTSPASDSSEALTLKAVILARPFLH